jgi:uncharacterized caspase-like protein
VKTGVIAVVAGIFVLAWSFCCCPVHADTDSPVQQSHVEMINSLFAKNGLQNAFVRIDKYGRIELVGNYKDSQEVEFAFSLAQSVAGVRWVSPVTPENVKLKKWGNVFKDAAFLKKSEEVPAIPPAIKAGATTRKGPRNKYAVVVGVSKFNYNEKYMLKHGRELDLRYAAKDATDVYDYLIDPKSGNFSKKNVTLLVNENATRSNIQNALSNVRRKAEAEDAVIVYFSSHGKPIHDGSMNIVTYDTDLSSLFKISQTSFSSEELKDFILKTRAKHLVAVLDVCYSGQAFRNINGFYNAQSTINFSEDNQGISRTVMAKSLLGSKDIVLEDEVVSETALVDKDAIRVLISASDHGEQSWESDALKSSVFTRYFVDGLKKKSTVKQAFEFAQPNVIRHVKEEKQKEQHPQAVTNRDKWDIAL